MFGRIEKFRGFFEARQSHSFSKPPEIRLEVPVRKAIKPARLDRFTGIAPVVWIDGWSGSSSHSAPEQIGRRRRREPYYFVFGLPSRSSPEETPQQTLNYRK